jgi:hypothetical protein
LNVNLKIYFKQYCKLLSKVILAAKKKNLTNSNNKIIGTWKIINEENGKTKRSIGIQSQ